MYIMVNNETGEVKKFTTFANMQEWWKRLTIEESLKWAGWRHINVIVNARNNLEMELYEYV